MAGLDRYQTNSSAGGVTLSIVTPYSLPVPKWRTAYTSQGLETTTKSLWNCLHCKKQGNVHCIGNCLQNQHFCWLIDGKKRTKEKSFSSHPQMSKVGCTWSPSSTNSWVGDNGSVRPLNGWRMNLLHWLCWGLAPCSSQKITLSMNYMFVLFYFSLFALVTLESWQTV